MADIEKEQKDTFGEPSNGLSSCIDVTPFGNDTRPTIEEIEVYAPSTILIMIGSMHFEHAGNADVLSLKISSPEDRMGTLEDARKQVAPNTVEALHVVSKSSSISSLFDDSILSTFYDVLIPGKGEVMVHILPESSALADEMPVQADDVDAIRMGLVMAGYQLEMEQQQDGSWILLARKPGLSSVDEVEEEDDNNDNENSET
ncbi:hypothetical protein IV203_018487 [Nitzschia inconspicua]|uniref:Uncharacterized protein n=1 Tax=Nitzschia inconspicua TaxID=303405 RepID=A0A9K3Q8R7_9STRA|nr:hypothetical protein IV203_018487 [Nitzschia inconspicua]